MFYPYKISFFIISYFWSFFLIFSIFQFFLFYSISLHFYNFFLFLRFFVISSIFEILYNFPGFIYLFYLFFIFKVRKRIASKTMVSYLRSSLIIWYVTVAISWDGIAQLPKLSNSGTQVSFGHSLWSSQFTIHGLHHWINVKGNSNKSNNKTKIKSICLISKTSVILFHFSNLSSEILFSIIFLTTNYQ